VTTKQLYKELNYVDGSREKRLKYANLILSEPELLPELLEIIFMVDDSVSCKAAWVFEFACSKNLDLIIPHLDVFTEKLSKVYLDSTLRPLAKISELLATAYYSKQTTKFKSALQLRHHENIIEACFDWLINDGKIAPKAYAMNTLFLFGKDYNWIHPELKNIIQRDYQNQSPGYKARARHILKAIENDRT